MPKSFSASVNGWIAKSQRRTTAVFRESTQRTLDAANTTVGNGGRLRFDTGFLRSSLAASLATMPSGPSRREDGMGSEEDVSLVIAQARVGQTIYAGWTAEYAAPREARDAFLAAEVQKWRQTVNKVAAEVRRSIK
jgi:hypothetical protein